MGSRAAIILGGEIDSSRSTKENIPSRRLQISLSCFRYCAREVRKEKDIIDIKEYQWNDDLAVGMSLEFYTGANGSAERNVIIDFTIDSEYNLAILTN